MILNIFLWILSLSLCFVTCEPLHVLRSYHYHGQNVFLFPFTSSPLQIFSLRQQKGDYATSDHPLVVLNSREKDRRVVGQAISKLTEDEDFVQKNNARNKVLSALDNCRADAKLLSYWWRKLDEKGVKVNAQCVKSLLAQTVSRSLAEPLKLSEVASILKQLEPSLYLNNSLSVNLLLKIYMTLGDKEAILTVFNSAPSFVLNDRVLPMLIKHFSTLGEMDMCKFIFKSHITALNSNLSLRPSSEIFNSYLQSLLLSEQEEVK